MVIIEKVSFESSLFEFLIKSHDINYEKPQIHTLILLGSTNKILQHQYSVSMATKTPSDFIIGAHDKSDNTC